MKLTRDDLKQMGRDPETGRKRSRSSDATTEPEPAGTADRDQQLGWTDTDEACSFTLHGRPSVWQRRVVTDSGRSFMPEDVTDAEAHVLRVSRQARPDGWQTDGWYRLAATYCYPDMRFGDVSNLTKLIEDGINGPEGGCGSLWQDDRQVAVHGRIERLVQRNIDGYTNVTVTRIEATQGEDG